MNRRASVLGFGLYGSPDRAVSVQLTQRRGIPSPSTQNMLGCRRPEGRKVAMPLFEIGNDELVPFRRVQAGEGLYEEEIVELLWANLEAFVGVPLFPVAREPTLSGKLRADIVALDDGGHVHVVEVKRDVARDQLAQCLEYAGWARGTSLDELAAMFHAGSEAFFDAWVEFTDTKAPRLIQRPPQLVLVARDFDDRTDAALRYLAENGLPITVLGVTVYQDREGRRFVDVGADHNPRSPRTDATVGLDRSVTKSAGVVSL